MEEEVVEVVAMPTTVMVVPILWEEDMEAMVGTVFSLILEILQEKTKKR